MNDTKLRALLEEKLKEAMTSTYDSTSMALELICEDLFYNHNIDAKYHGRSVFIGDRRVASIRTCVEPCEDARVLGIYEYKIFVKGGEAA